MKIKREAYDRLTPEQKVEADKYLADLKAAIDENPLLNFKPHPKQALFLAAKQRKKVLFGGNRSGKTECAIANDVIQCIDEEAVPDHLKAFKKLQPPVKGRIVTPKFAHHEETTFPKLRALIPKHQLFKSNWEDAFSKSNRRLSFANGSTIQFLTFDQDIDAHASVDLDFTHFDEEPEGQHGWNVYQENLTRLIDRSGDFYLSMTPLLGMSWTFEEYGEDWEAGHDPATDIYEDAKRFIVRIDMDDNPHISGEAKEEIIAAWSKEERRARKEGRFVHFGGMIYPEFNEEAHVCDDLSLEHVSQLDHFVSIDPGINTTAVVFTGFDRDNAAWIYDELYLHDAGAIPEQAAVTIKSRLEEWGVRKPTFLIDPSARNRASVNADNVQAAYLRAGILALPAQNAVEAGIFEVKRRLQHTPPMIHVSRRCEQWRWECKRYRRKPNENDQSAFDVVKRDDHLMDATRYALMARPIAPIKPARPRIKRIAYTHDYQAPYSEERIPITESAPLGPMS